VRGVAASGDPPKPGRGEGGDGEEGGDPGGKADGGGKEVRGGKEAVDGGQGESGQVPEAAARQLHVAVQEVT